MAADIIQHHSPVDLDSLFESIKSLHVGLDYNDYSNFLYLSGEKHSFIGYAQCNDRVRNALGNAVGTDEAAEIINRASAIMLTVFRSSQAERPLTMEELNKFIVLLPDNCDITWGLAEDDTLGNAIKVMVLANITD